MEPLTFDFTIDFPGELSAGLRPYTETVAIVVESGDVPEPAQFAEHMKQALADWFDGATVTTGPRHRRMKVEPEPIRGMTDAQLRQRYEDRCRELRIPIPKPKEFDSDYTFCATLLEVIEDREIALKMEEEESLRG